MTTFKRCRIVPLAGHQVSFELDDREVLRWNFGADYPRPFFFPVIAPSGALLTRMGHPGAPDHDHHQSIWFAHHKVLGIDFWSNSSSAHIRQERWLAYDDGDESCRMAVELDWFDGHDPAALLTQQLLVEVAPIGSEREFTIEFQSRFIPKAESLEFGQTNFGFLAVRVAKSVSAHFGGGLLTNSEGRRSEERLFEQPAKWIDYSGSTSRLGTIEGITYFDHQNNPGQPTRWHVRDDGWMCASPCMGAPLPTTASDPIELRYLLFIHRGEANAAQASKISQQFDDSKGMTVETGSRPHARWTIIRSN